jgi:integrase
MEEIRQATVYGVRPKRSFREAATKYLLEHQHKASIACDGLFFRQLDAYIGDLRLDQVHDGTLRRFVEDRRKDGRKTKTVNLALSAVRRVLNLAARKWRDEHGLTWLQTAPLISMLPVTDARAPYPLSWDEQRMLFQALPAHLARMALFKVNTGTRDQEVCGLRWEWEVRIPELDTSLFLIPGKFVKNREDRVVVLNAVARRVIDEVRGIHPDFVFTYHGRPVGTMHNSGWQAARARAAKKYQDELGAPAPEGFKNIRVHDLKHTFGRRLRAAGVSLETRKVLLGHTSGDITSHYSAPELHELIEAVNRVCAGDSGKIPALTLIKTKSG